MEAAAEIRDPVHGYIHLTPVERDLIDHPIFQRLRRIRQLAGAHLTYPGAQHSRFEHLIGAMHLAGLAGHVLAPQAGLDPHEQQELRLAALLHDIGHGPFSHLFEEVMTEKRNVTHEDLAQRIIQTTALAELLQRYGFDPPRLAPLTIGLSPHHPPFLNDIIGGGLSVDIMDYLLRDSYFTGVEYGRVDVHRLLNSFLIIDNHLALDAAALYAYEALLIARYEMFKAVYFHRTVRAAEIMLVRALDLADDHLHLTDTTDLAHYLALTDEVVLHQLSTLPTNTETLRRAHALAERYRDRQLVKMAYERVIHRKDRFIERVFNQKAVREELAATIARDAHVPPEDIWIDVPTVPSVPYTSTRQSFTTLTLVRRSSNGQQTEAVPIDDLGPVASITGYLDIMRVYTTPEHRSAVERAVDHVFGKETFATRVSM